jgi:predicted nucleic acid-binding protein
MSAICFVDTNLFVYAKDASEDKKQPVAQEWLDRLWENRWGRTGIQVLSEYFVTVTRKLSPGLTEDLAWNDVEDLLSWNPVPVDGSVLRRSREITNRFSLSWWDAQIVAAAHSCNADCLLTEDLQHGQDLDGLKIVNPFRRAPDDVLGNRR